MIPKRLIFIWIGNDIPDYGAFCIDSFRKVNPDFDVLFVHEPNLTSPKNPDVIDLIDLLNSGKKTVYSYMFDRLFARTRLNSTVGKLTCFSDALRLYLLNKYGGVYLDLDTFPVKRFDDKLLSYPNGFVVNHDRDHCDFFFIGANAGFIDDGHLAIYPKSSRHLFSKSMHRIKYMDYLRQIYHRNVKTVSEKFFSC